MNRHMNADTDPNLMIPRTAFREARARHDRYRERVAEIAGWIERDRREPDKVLCHLSSLRRAALDAAFQGGHADG